MAMRFVEAVGGALVGARVDRTGGVIYGAKLCGFSSQNGTDYSAALFRRDIGKYDGAVVNYGHTLKGEVPVERVAGRVRSPRVGDAGEPRGDLHLLTSHPNAPAVLEAAERDPGLFGLSHVIDADWKPGKNGRRVVESIKRVVSVDLVSTPATTKGLFESRGGRRVSLVEQFCRRSQRGLAAPTAALLSHRLVEMGEVDHLDDAGALDLDADDATELAATLAQSFRDAIAKVSDKFLNRGADKQATLAELGRLFDAFLDAAGVDDVPAAGTGSESRRPVPATAAGFAESIREGGPRSPVHPHFRESLREALGLPPDPADVDAFVRSIRDR